MNFTKNEGNLASATLQTVFKQNPIVKNGMSGNVLSVSAVVNREITRDDIYQLELTGLNYTMKRSGNGVNVKFQNKVNE
ncbi:hypothetical protein [Flavobacterium sp. PLA-1-15]|uniref:hypothetical protein n=1 Tax=Flavobacterium sp. PLA-1-15 TaxID=3380533 RepID=UPI003B9814C2